VPPAYKAMASSMTTAQPAFIDVTHGEARMPVRAHGVFIWSSLDQRSRHCADRSGPVSHQVHNRAGPSQRMTPAACRERCRRAVPYGVFISAWASTESARAAARSRKCRDAPHGSHHLRNEVAAQYQWRTAAGKRHEAWQSVSQAAEAFPDT
jgi:hypothetical protein